jgi:hypothetical protein
MTMRTRARSLSRGVESRIDLTGSALTTTSTSTPHFGDMVTFTISTTETSNPFVNLNCYQNGILVSVGWSAFSRGGTGQDFGLYSPSWQSGAADCEADLGMLTKNERWKVLASMSFHVDA